MVKLEQLVADLERYNETYRAGTPLISDHEYDQLVEKLRAVDPEHPFLHRVEPEVFSARRKIRHPAPMLSTEKAYNREALARFVSRVEKAAAEIGLDKIIFRVTVKLDGLAGRDDGDIFVSRGNGEEGYEISSAFEKGVRPQGGRGLGLGEIVMRQSYFTEHMQGEFEHPRNLVVGIVTSDQLNEYARRALKDGAVHFMPYAQLPDWTGSGADLLGDLQTIRKELLDGTDYPLDGLVAEVMDIRLRMHMGATSHHYRWQIAIKTKGATAVTTVERITWQVGRTGNVTPVMEVQPINLSGATIKRVTAHNAGMVAKQQIGPGAEIEIIRSGEVIPKLEKVIVPSRTVDLPETCPSCNTELVWQNDFLKCPNRSLCRCQVIQGIVYWFRTLGNADWFGLKTVEKLVDGGYDSLEKLYAMTAGEFVQLGFGPVQSVNLAGATITSREKEVEDWRLLAAFGIRDLGKGDSRKLLGFFRLEALPDITAGDIQDLHGFGEVTSRSITSGIRAIKDTFQHMLALTFNLMRTPLESEKKQISSPLSGLGIVFSGKMKRGSRQQMQTRARELGAKVQTAVSGATRYLVCGEKVGAAKIAKAEKSGVQVISEDDFFDLIQPRL
jgi:DNA ligase (NAD+)